MLTAQEAIAALEPGARLHLPETDRGGLVHWLTAAAKQIPALQVQQRTTGEIDLTWQPESAATPHLAQPAARPGRLGSASPPGIRLYAGGGATAVFHHGLSNRRRAEEYQLLSAAQSGVLLFLSILPQIRHAHAAVIAPAGHLSGPVDALTFAKPPGWYDGPISLPVSWQVVVGQQTRCWLVAISVDLTAPLGLNELLPALQDAPQVTLLPRNMGFTGTGTLCEFAKNFDRPDASFAQIVLFPQQLSCAKGKLQCWFAVHDMILVRDILHCALLAQGIDDDGLKQQIETALALAWRVVP